MTEASLSPDSWQHMQDLSICQILLPETCDSPCRPPSRPPSRTHLHVRGASPHARVARYGLGDAPGLLQDVDHGRHLALIRGYGPRPAHREQQDEEGGFPWLRHRALRRSGVAPGVICLSGGGSASGVGGPPPAVSFTHPLMACRGRGGRCCFFKGRRIERFSWFYTLHVLFCRGGMGDKWKPGKVRKQAGGS